MKIPVNFSVVSLIALAPLASSHSIHPRDIVRRTYGASSPQNINVTTTDQASFSFDELYSLQETLWDSFLFPANIAQVKAINSTLFAEDVQGRVDLTRTFTGRELNTEYIFGLFANVGLNPNSVSLVGVPLSYEIQKFTANENIASASTRFMLNFTTIDVVLPVVLETWIVWNSEGQISEYDATFKWFQWALDYLIELAQPKLGTNSTTETIETISKLLASSICDVAAEYCTGSNEQYSSPAACFDFLTTDIRFGEAYELGRNTLLCRMVHQTMVPFRPGVHCPHIGPSGGGYCSDDTTYVGTVEQTYFTNAPFIPTDCS